MKRQNIVIPFNQLLAMVRKELELPNDTEIFSVDIRTFHGIQCIRIGIFSKTFPDYPSDEFSLIDDWKERGWKGKVVHPCDELRKAGYIIELNYANRDWGDRND